MYLVILFTHVFQPHFSNEMYQWMKYYFFKFQFDNECDRIEHFDFWFSFLSGFLFVFTLNCLGFSVILNKKKVAENVRSTCASIITWQEMRKSSQMQRYSLFRKSRSILLENHFIRRFYCKMIWFACCWERRTGF